jgi:nucleotide-binding universal stress UspA family protein
MYAHILVPLDGSPRAERALPAAGRIARASGGTLILACVVTQPVQYGYGPFGPLGADTTERDCSDAETYLTHITTSPVLEGISTTTLVCMGSPVPSLLEVMSSHHTDLVVMTTHGRTGLTRWVLGSVTQHLVRQAVVPILVLHEQGPTLAIPHPDVDHLFCVLVPLDGSPLAEAALTPAVQLATALGGNTSADQPGQARLHLVLVVSPSEIDKANMPDALIVQGAKEYLRDIAKRLRQEQAGLTITWSVGVGSDSAETIIRVAENGEDVEGAGLFGGGDVLVMATHGRTGMAHWALGSITERVLSGTKLPLLVVHPPQVSESKTPAEALSQ